MTGLILDLVRRGSHAYHFSIIAFHPLVCLTSLRLLLSALMVIISQSLRKGERLSLFLSLIELSILFHQEDASTRFLYKIQS